MTTPATDGAALGEALLLTPRELRPGDVYFQWGRRIVYLGDDLGEIDDNRRVCVDQVFAFCADYLIVYRPACPDSSVLARLHRRALAAVGADDRDTDQQVLETAHVTGRTV